jgi:hypothetical protein
MLPIRRIITWPWYPWLFTIYPILHLFAANITLFYENEVAQAIGVTLLATTVLFLVGLALVRHVYTAAALTLIIQIPFFTYGHIYTALDGGGQQWLMPAMLMGTLLAEGVIYRARQTSQKLSPYLNMITILLLAFPLWQVISYYLELSKTDLLDNVVVLERSSTRKAYNDLAHPDIYYIILDGYPSNSFMLQHNAYDNSAFTDALEARGFYVAYDSKSNYGKTFASVASSLNMRYIDPAEKPAGPDTNPYLWSLMANNAVAHKLQADYGYTYVDILSGYSLPSTLADINIEFFPDRTEYFSGDEINWQEDGSWHYKQPFWPFFLETTFLRSLASSAKLEAFATEIYFWQEGLPYSWRSAERARAVFDTLETIPQMEAATFTYAHIMKPHEPVRFDRDGNAIDDATVMQDFEFYYFEQLHYINTRTLQVIDTILAHSTVPPIIIIQGDHGTNLGHSQDQAGTYKYFDILNAYYFPQNGSGVLSPAVTPVNSFRLMFNRYFGEHYTLLPDRYFDIPKGLDDMFFYVEVVDDGRLNVDLGDKTALLYPATNDAGEAEILVFAVDENGGQGELRFTLTQVDVTPYLSTPPEQNTLILSDHSVAVYALTSSEIQFNIGPDPDGNTWAVIIDNIPAKIIYGYQVNHPT